MSWGPAAWAASAAARAASAKADLKVDEHGYMTASGTKALQAAAKAHAAAQAAHEKALSEAIKNRDFMEGSKHASAANEHSSEATKHSDAVKIIASDRSLAKEREAANAMPGKAGRAARLRLVVG